MAKYGSDKPDLRPGLEIQDLRELFRESNFRVFKEIVAKGGTVRGFVIPKASHYSRSEVDGIVDMAKQQLGATGLVWARRADDGVMTSSVMKAMGEEEVRTAARCELDGQWQHDVHRGRRAGHDIELLGQLRLILAKKDGLLRPDQFRLHVGRGLSFAGMGPGGEALQLDAPPVHFTARRRHREARAGSGQHPRESVRPRPERQ
jgi:aspartyl-tRNA synthetase